MEFMETFPLNVAHQLERQAEFHLERKHFDETIQCYQKAVQKLKEAEQRSSDKLFVQSVRYQQERCIQLQKIVSMKKARYLVERARQQNILAKLEQTSNERSQEASNLQDQIKRELSNLKLMEATTEEPISSETLNSYCFFTRRFHTLHKFCLTSVVLG